MAETLRGRTAGEPAAHRDGAEGRADAQCEGENRYRDMVELTSDLIWEVDAEGRYTYFSPRLRDLLGYEPEELLGKTPVDLLPPEDRPRFETLFRAIRDARQPVRALENRNVRKDGRLVDLETNAVPFFDAEGNLAGYRGMDRDITARKKAEEGLRFLAEAGDVLAASLDYETTLRRIVHLAVPFLADWSVLDVFVGGRELPPVVAHVDPAKEPLAIEMQRRYPPHPEAVPSYAEMLRTGRPILIPEVTPALLDSIAQDAEHQRMLQEMGLTSFIVVPLISRGRQLGAMMFADTGSGRRYGPEELTLAEELARRAALAVDNAQAYQREAQARAEAEQRVLELRELQESREDLLRAVSHDLRNPMTAVQLQAQRLLQLLDQAGAVSGERQAAQAILTGTQRMNAMIRDLVDSARLESGHIDLALRLLNLCDFVHDLLERQTDAMQTGRVRLKAPAKLPSVCADPDRLERILVNLLANALKYSQPDTEVTVTLRQEGDEVTTAISDHGPGIAPEDLPHLFERYYRAPGRGARPEGLGLGLYITRGLVQAHGGRIWAESQVGVGSTFSFTLPLHCPPACRGAAPNCKT